MTTHDAALPNSLDQTLIREALNDSMTTLTPRIHGAASVLALNGVQVRLSDVRLYLRRREPVNSSVTGERAASVWLELLGGNRSYRHDGAAAATALTWAIGVSTRAPG
ncbi:MAG: hypothetical protein JW781_04720 [Deltaproteobacteria bacterium]|nr:hypothetical protein [Candidatus Anaeroferrophillacea bacterium]